MCNFNYGRFIAQAVDSVLKQSYADLELIIVDDGSTDNSKEIIESYHDRRISTIFQSNKGQAAAFNAGFERAKGDFPFQVAMGTPLSISFSYSAIFSSLDISNDFFTGEFFKGFLIELNL